jgi:hypothetical protein
MNKSQAGIDKGTANQRLASKGVFLYAQYPTRSKPKNWFHCINKDWSKNDPVIKKRGLLRAAELYMAEELGCRTEQFVAQEYTRLKKSGASHEVALVKASNRLAQKLRLADSMPLEDIYRAIYEFTNEKGMETRLMVIREELRQRAKDKFHEIHIDDRDRSERIDDRAEFLRAAIDSPGEAEENLARGVANAELIKEAILLDVENRDYKQKLM